MSELFNLDNRKMLLFRKSDRKNAQKMAAMQYYIKGMNNNIT